MGRGQFAQQWNAYGGQMRVLGVLELKLQTALWVRGAELKSSSAINY